MTAFLSAVQSYFHADSSAAKTLGTTALAGICGYGGAFFFTSVNPLTAASYIATATLTSQVVYQVLEKIKQNVTSPSLKNIITAVQLLQVSVVFYALSGAPVGVLNGVEKLEVVTATAYFIAIPIFIYLAKIAWDDPTLPNVVAVLGVLLPLANGLGGYARQFKNSK